MTLVAGPKITYTIEPVDSLSWHVRELKCPALRIRSKLRLTFMTLPENEYLPSVEALSSVRPRALGKDVVCQVPGLGHSAKKRHTACPEFAECRPSANNSTRQRVTFAECWLGGTRQSLRMCPARVPPVSGADGVKSLPSASTWHSAKLTLCCVPRAGTRQRGNVAECIGLALGIVSFAEC